MSHILHLFDTLASVNLEHDVNIIELVRLSSRAISSDLLTPHLPSISTIIFTRPNPQRSVLRSWLFSVFFESYSSFFHSTPSILSSIISSESFVSAFPAFAADATSSSLTFFWRCISATSTDVSALVSANLPALLRCDAGATAVLLSVSPSVSLGESDYCAVANAILRSVRKSTPGRSATLRALLLMLARLARDRPLPRPSVFTERLPELLGALASPAFADAAPALADAIVAIAAHAPELREAVRAGAEAAAPAVAAVRLRLTGGNAEERAQAAEAALAPFFAGEVAEVDLALLAALREFVAADGADAHERWAKRCEIERFIQT